MLFKYYNCSGTVVFMYFVPTKVNIYNFAEIFRLSLCWEDAIGINGMPGTTELFYYIRHQHCLNTTLCRSVVSVLLSYLMVWPR